ncbi:unnamed protein product [Diamesa hyperborea]
MNKVIILLLSVLIISTVSATLSPSKTKKGKQQKDKELILKVGPVEKNVYERELVIEEPTGNSIVIESGTYFKETGLKNFNGTVLGYVTPWNSHGYDVAKMFRKFEIISPVWLQIVRKGDLKYELAGTHDIDSGWINDVKKSGGSKIYPRVLFDHFTDKDFSKMLTFQNEIDVVSKMLLDSCRKNKFEGIVLEVWSQLSARVDDQHLINLVKSMAIFLKSGGFGLVLVVPPSRKETVDLFTSSHFDELWQDVTAFSLMTYDFSSVQRPGANAPIYWVRNAVEHISSSYNKVNLVEKRAKILLGLNFYGNDYIPEGGSPIIGHEYINLLKNLKGRLKLDEKDKENFFEVKTGSGRHLVFYPTLFSINQRLDLAREMGCGISIWELGQGLDYFYDLF